MGDKEAIAYLLVGAVGVGDEALLVGLYGVITTQAPPRTQGTLAAGVLL